MKISSPDVKHYVLTLVGVAAAALVRYLLGNDLLGSIPVVMFTVPVAASAFYGGFGPALFATICSGLISTYLFVPPYYSLRLEELASVLVVATFLAIGLILSFLGKRLHQLRRKADQQARQLEAENERKDEFLAMVAHELRNPLSAISTANQLLTLARTEEKNVISAREVITRQVGHMTRLVDDLLDASRLKRGLVTVVRSPLDMKVVIDGAIEQTASLFRAKGQCLKIDLPAEAAIIEGDETRLIQALANLLVNASRYSGTGARVMLSLEKKSAEVVVTVSDPGEGIDPELLPRIFEHFVQTKTGGGPRLAGLGLGLAVVKQIVDLHSGGATAYSEGIDRGSVFTLRLPILRNESKVTGASHRAL